MADTPGFLPDKRKIFLAAFMKQSRTDPLTEWKKSMCCLHPDVMAYRAMNAKDFFKAAFKTTAHEMRHAKKHSNHKKAGLMACGARFFMRMMEISW